MSILAYGLNYRTASVELRERVAFPADHLQDALRQIKRDVAGLDEAAIMSTCNRTELYCAIHPDAERDLSLWLSKHRSVEFAELDNAAYKHWDPRCSQPSDTCCVWPGQPSAGRTPNHGANKGRLRNRSRMRHARDPSLTSYHKSVYEPPNRFEHIQKSAATPSLLPMLLYH